MAEATESHLQDALKALQTAEMHGTSHVQLEVDSIVCLNVSLVQKSLGYGDSQEKCKM